MKVERKEAEFKPVVITLESQEEVDMMWELAASIKGSGWRGIPMTSSQNFAYSLFDNLDGHESSEMGSGELYFKGTVTPL